MCDAFGRTFLKRQNCSDGEQIGGCRGGAGRVRLYRESTRQLWGSWIGSSPEYDYGGGYRVCTCVNMCRTTLTPPPSEEVQFTV